MELSKVKFTKSQVNKAGELLVKKSITYDEYVWAMEVVDNWRACHVYPINTFQSTLRARVKRISSDAIVAQRLKRIPSIILKLKRTKGMQLARMQDIGGLRAILNTIDMVYGLKEAYVKGFFEHELIRLYDYIDRPKISGYRGIHLIYKYKNENVKNFDGMLLELQIRTKLQHAWAMAVETIGTFLNQPLKSSLGKPEWLDYFKLVSAAFSTIENTNQVPTYENVESVEIYRDVEKQTHRLGILDKLMGFAVAAKNITSSSDASSYHLIVLNTKEKTVFVKGFAKNKLVEANKMYSEFEREAAAGNPIQTVLVSTNSVENLRKAYPSFFGDTQEFVRQLHRVIAMAVNSRHNES